MTVRPLCVALLAALAVPSTTVAQTQHAHVHGQAFVDVAVVGALVDIRLRATAHDLVGFERKAENAEEEAKIEAVRQTVLDHGRIWQFSIAAGCAADVPVIEMPTDTRHDHAGHDQGGHDHEGHDHDGHDHDGHDHDHDHADHDHGSHDHGDHDHGGHADWLVSYRIRCATPQRLRSIDTGLFAAFPSLRSVTVQLLDAGGAREVTLTPDARRLSLTP